MEQWYWSTSDGEDALWCGPFHDRDDAILDAENNPPDVDEWIFFTARADPELSTPGWLMLDDYQEHQGTAE